MQVLTGVFLFIYKRLWSDNLTNIWIVKDIADKHICKWICDTFLKQQSNWWNYLKMLSFRVHDGIMGYLTNTCWVWYNSKCWYIIIYMYHLYFKKIWTNPYLLYSLIYNGRCLLQLPSDGLLWPTIMEN